MEGVAVVVTSKLCKCGGVLWYYNIGFDDGYSCQICHRIYEFYELKDLRDSDDK